MTRENSKPEIIELAYGRGYLPVELEKSVFSITTILPKNHPPLDNPRDEFFRKAADPIGAVPLAEMVEKTGKEKPDIVIVTADHTRPVPDYLLVPWIVDALGVDDSCITLLVGTGTHRGSTEEELERMIGRECMERFTVVNHDCQDESHLVTVGTTSCGGTCRLNSLYVDADIRIATGFIEPHLFAGFSGGTKSVVPGIASLDTVSYFHRAELIAHPKATYGIIDGNPLLSLTREMVSLCPPDSIVNVTLNLEKKITDVFVGDCIAAHLGGCRRALDEATVAIPRRYPVVITTNSGYPLDMNFYQTIKGISAAANIVEKGGTIIAAGECSDRIPADSEFEKLLAMDISSDELLTRIVNNKDTWYDQWQVQTLLQINKKCDVILYSALSERDRELTRVSHTDDIAETLKNLAEKYDEKPLPVAAMPMGPLTIPILGE